MMSPYVTPTLKRYVLTIRWRANSGRVYVRSVHTGHCSGEHFDHIAVLNVGMRGTVIEWQAKEEAA